jgi:ATP-dependent 26S proteasome regulatory subunit
MPPKQKRTSTSDSASGSSSSSNLSQLTIQIRSGKAGLFVQSYEERRVQREIIEIAKFLTWDIYLWSITEGLINAQSGKRIGSADEPTQNPMVMLKEFGQLPEKSLVIARDFHMLLKGECDPVLVRMLKDVLLDAQSHNRAFVIVGCQFHMPPELQKEITLIEFKLPGRDLLKETITGIAKSAELPEPENGQMEKLIDSASGLTTSEAADACSVSVVEAQGIVPEIVAREKAQTVKKNGVLQIVESKFTAKDVGGLSILKNWIGRRKLAFTKKAKEFGLPVPKGVLLVGIPGSGKSLSAQVAASTLEVPLLRLDAGSLFGSHVGESERNMRLAIQTAEAVSPCVLWVDEIEKGFSGSKSSGSTDGGTSARVFGTFLQWMQDKTASVFVIATANDISQLPPEFLRKGRFDELFFVDLPSGEEREEIWTVHINKRDRDADDYNVAELASRTNGFTGAEIESCVNEALYAAFDAETHLQEKHLLEAVENTVPLSKTMSAEIERLRGWAQGRARRASEDTEAKAAVMKGQGLRKLA